MTVDGHQMDPGRTRNELKFGEYLELIDEDNRRAIENFLQTDDHAERLATRPGSRESHHAWRSGYQEHVRQTMEIAKTLYDYYMQTGAYETLSEGERFSLSDALTVMFLHDIEKPFLYGFDEEENIINERKMTKPERKSFREEVIAEFGFKVNETMANALKYVEGVPDEDYVPGERADQSLAALCHAADTISARMMYNFRGPDA